MKKLTQVVFTDYVRVSGADQNEEQRHIAMAQEGLKEKDIFMDKQSGKDLKRPAYLKMLKTEGRGSRSSESMDRLGHQYEIIEQWRHITKVIRAEYPRTGYAASRDDAQGRIYRGTFIADLVAGAAVPLRGKRAKKNTSKAAQRVDAALARGVRFGEPDSDSEVMLEAVRLYRQRSLCRALDMVASAGRRFIKAEGVQRIKSPKYTFHDKL